MPRALVLETDARCCELAILATEMDRLARLRKPSVELSHALERAELARGSALVAVGAQGAEPYAEHVNGFMRGLKAVGVLPAC